MKFTFCLKIQSCLRHAIWSRFGASKHWNAEGRHGVDGPSRGHLGQVTGRKSLSCNRSRSQSCQRAGLSSPLRRDTARIPITSLFTVLFLSMSPLIDNVGDEKSALLLNVTPASSSSEGPRIGSMKASPEMQPVPSKGKYLAHLICWLIGLGSLLTWNSMLTVMDYYNQVFPHYHPSRVLTLVYQPFAFTTVCILTYHEAKIDTRFRILFGFSLFVVASALVPVLDLATSGRGGIGPYIGVCILSAAFGLADASVQGGIVGDLSFMNPNFLQSFAVGIAASGAVTSSLRLITKAAFPETRSGLRKGAITFFFLSTAMELVCLLLYAFVFPRLELVRHYRSVAASEGATTVNADLAAGGVSVEDVTKKKDLENRAPLTRFTTLQLLQQNLDYAFDLFAIYVLTLSIFPGFVAEDTGNHGLGTWYVVVLVAMYNYGDLIGRYLPLIEAIKIKSRPLLMAAILFRFLFIPAFYFTAKYGDQGWMIMLCILLGITNGHLTVCVLVQAPAGYKGPEQNALGNILVLFLLGGIFAGVTLDWLWLIGKGW